MRVLLVDDSAEFRAAAREHLQGLLGALLVGEASDGHQAIAESQRLEPDLVLMDLRMPRASGIEATPSIRALPCKPSVVLFTVNPSAPLRAAALAAGADDLFAKSDFSQSVATALVRLAAD